MGRRTSRGTGSRSSEHDIRGVKAVRRFRTGAERRALMLGDPYLLIIIMAFLMLPSVPAHLVKRTFSSCQAYLLILPPSRRPLQPDLVVRLALDRHRLPQRSLLIRLRAGATRSRSRGWPDDCRVVVV